MASRLMELTGVNDQLEVYDDKVIIRRKNTKAKFSGDKTIYLNQITGVEFTKAGTILAGYIQFTLPGSVSSKHGIHDAVHNENSVIFNKKYNDVAEEIKTKIEALIENQSKLNDSQSKSNDPDILRNINNFLMMV
ncbi:MAG: DUF4429 domain-containing protein [Methanosarcina sp.]